MDTCFIRTTYRTCKYLIILNFDRIYDYNENVE